VVDSQLIAIFEGFALQGGSWRHNPGSARIVEYASRVAPGKRDKLAVVIEMLSASAIPSILYDRVFAAFTGAYSRASGNVVQALREGFAGANELLLDVNRRADDDHQILAGLHTAVMQEDELYLAQAGPVMAVMLHEDQLVCSPEDSPWLYPDGVNSGGEKRDQALGQSADISPHFSRARLSPGDTLLLCGTRLVAQLTEEELFRAMAASHEGALAAVFGPLLRQQNAVGLMITIARSPRAAVRKQAVLPEPQPEVPAQVEEQPEQAPAPAAQAPVNEHPAQEWRKQGKLLGGSVLLVTSLLIPLVLMVMVIAARLQYESLRRREFNDLRTTAQVQYEAAMATEDQTAQRRAMSEALQRTEDALLALPNDTQLLSLRQRIVNRLDSINNVSRLYYLTRLVEIQDPGMDDSASRIIVAGQNVFLLNRGSSRVYHLLLNSSGDEIQPLDDKSLILEPGRELGGIVINHVVDIVWMAADVFTRRSQLMALERSGSLAVYEPETGLQGMSLIPVGNSDLWLGPQAVGRFGGNLYILDPLQSRILKYVPVDGSDYTLPPVDYLDPMLGIDLTGVVDMAIDGNIYLLYVDGRIVKFLEGVQQPFSMQGLPSSMTSPLALCVTGDGSEANRGYVYVADPGSARILQFDKDGNYIRQFMANVGDDTLANLQAFYIDEPTGRLFIVSKGAIWLTTVPPLVG